MKWVESFEKKILWETEVEPICDAYWISPIGKIYPVLVNHITFVINNYDLFNYPYDRIMTLYKQENEELYTEGKAREIIILELFRKGWIRIRYYPRNATWSINVYDLGTKSSHNLSKWANIVIRDKKHMHDSIKLDLPTGIIHKSIHEITELFQLKKVGRLDI